VTTISSITFYVGLGLIIVAIIGGGIEVKEIKIPSLGLVPRILSFVPGCGLLALYLLDPEIFPRADNHGPEPPPSGPERSFKVIPYSGTGIALNSENGKYQVLVFYRQGRVEDAGRIVGAMRMAGYRCDAAESDLNEVIATDRRPNTTLIKTTSDARPIAEELARVTRLAIPINAAQVSVAPEDNPSHSRDGQVILF
jgi:hypothetical protein